MAKFGPLLLIYGATCGMFILLFDFAHMGSTVSVHGLSRIGSRLPAFDTSSLGLFLLVQSMARPGSASFFFGMLRSNSSMLVLDSITVGSMVSMRSLG